jgi:tetratricopeptide (TPR) repeat protein
MTFYHDHDPYGKYRFAAGARIETVRDDMKFQGLTADGESTNKITFSGAGYELYLRKYKKFEIIQKPSLADTLILRNVDFTGNDVTNTYFISILGTQSQLAAPLIFLNVKIDRLQNGTDVFLRSCAILDFEVDSMKVSISKIGSSPTMIDNVRLSNSFLSLNSDIKSLNDASELRIVDSEVSIYSQSEIFTNGGLSLKFINSEFDYYSNNKWEGFRLENSGNDSIINCTFSNAKTALSFVNDEQHKFTNRIIKNCTFNIPSGGDHKGIYGENNYSILVEGNRFNMPTSPGGSPFYTGLYLKNVTPSSPPEVAGEEGASATPYSLNIVNNTFRNGSSGIVLANYTSNLLPYYIKGNRFDSLDAHAATVNIIGMKITGIIKDNVLSSSQSPIGIHLINSSPNLLNNILVARDVSLHLVGSSYANLAPNIYNNQAYWSGGRNTLSSYLYDNIQLAYMGNAYTDYGRNKFTVSNDSAYHIYGWLDTNVLRYHSRDNCWYTSGAAKIYLRHPGATMPVPSTTYNYGINCNSSPGPISWEVDNLGNGIFDSVLVSEDVSDSLPSAEEILISQCEYYLNEMQMFGEAMISLKYYIDDYPEGEYTNDALMNLYTAYLYLDTSANQNIRNILFGNLINYCEAKVASNLYDTQFEYLAGDVIAMCNFELDNYDDAMNWYEFIALYYPDPDIRLSASWNYAEIEALIGSGTGGGEVELRIKNYELGIKSKDENAELNRLSEAISDDPVMRKLKRQFENESGSKSGKTVDSKLADIHSDAVVKNTETAKSEIVKLKYDKARRNIFGSKGLSKQQMEADRMKDIVLIAKGERRSHETSNITGTPSEFALHQNYPNPFNPVTNIEYDLPVDGNIELKIYDIAGRLIKTLVNEFKTAGSYLVSFNASDLSSGVYFYSMNVDGKQIGVRRMTLVK